MFNYLYYFSSELSLSCVFQLNTFLDGFFFFTLSSNGAFSNKFTISTLLSITGGFDTDLIATPPFITVPGGGFLIYLLVVWQNHY